MGFEPATSSLGNSFRRIRRAGTFEAASFPMWLSIVNKDDSVFAGPDWDHTVWYDDYLKVRQVAADAYEECEKARRALLNFKESAERYPDNFRNRLVPVRVGLEATAPLGH